MIIGMHLSCSLGTAPRGNASGGRSDGHALADVGLAARALELARTVAEVPQKQGKAKDSPGYCSR